MSYDHIDGHCGTCPTGTRCGTCPNNYERLLGIEVAERAKKFKTQGYCRVCALGSAIDEVAEKHNMPRYDWQGVQQHVNYHCQCSKKEPPEQDLQVPFDW